MEASQNKIGNPVDQILLFCYHFDPTSAKYTPSALGYPARGRSGYGFDAWGDLCLSCCGETAGRKGVGPLNRLWRQKSFQLFPEAASSIAGQVDGLYAFLVLVSAFFSLLIAFLVVFFAVKYRRRSGD